MLKSEYLLKNLSFEKLNEMQQATQEAFQKTKDLILLAPTGSGKTLGFLHPLVLDLNKPNGEIQALILAPTRELALQIEDVAKRMKTGFKITTCYGGHSVRTELDQLAEPPTLLIGTPGRIDDLIRRGALNLEHVKTLVVDEFDKCLEMGFQEELSFILSRLTLVKKKVFTSATDLETLPSFVASKSPLKLNFLAVEKILPKLEYRKILIEDDTRMSTLYQLLCNLGNQSIMIFLNQREPVEEVSQYLDRKGIFNSLYHGGLEQVDRERALLKFRNGSTQVLVTTDLGARGLDIPEVSSVIHLQLPLKEDEFIHRNGRTARMENAGKIFILVEKEERLPVYLNEEFKNEVIATTSKSPVAPDWETLYIGKGKKDKINKVDVVGFLCQKGKLMKDEIGLIEVKDTNTYVAVKRSKIEAVVKLVKDEKIKNGKTKVEIAR